MWTASSTAMGMMKIGIIELIMWMVFPVIMSAPIVRTTETIATIIGEMMSDTRLKKNHIKRKMRAMAMGAEIAIWTNICTPNVSLATGSL